MTTLTAHTPRLPEHCPHKLPTSCRMSAPQCCACSDRRPHSLSYSKYIDGIGFVSLGTRHQNYCSYCKDFWTARIAVSALSRSSDARIPNVPDQTAFIEKWFEWHRGYTYVIDEHGNQELRGLIGERLDQVPPGHLPRTVDELNAHYPDHSSPHNPISSDTAARQTYNTSSLDRFVVHNTVETETQDFNPGDRLSDSLSSASSHLPSQISHIGTGFGSLASLRQELQRIRTGIEQVMSGIRDLGENSRSSQEAFGQSGILDTHIQEINGQLDALQQTRMSSPRPLPIGAIAPQNPRTNQHEAVTGSSTRPTASLALANLQSNANIMQGSEVSARTDQDGAARTLQRAENEVHAAAGSRRRLVRTYTDQEVAERVFGTREEVERQGADYESPVAGLFTRAYERYRDAEEARRNPEQDGATVRTLQRPQDARARPAGSPEAVASLNPPGSSSSFLSRRLPPNSPQSTAQARENQTRRPPSGSPSNILPGAGVTPRRPAPYSGSFQNLASQPSPQIQDYQYGQTLRQVAQLPEIPGVVPLYGQPARPMTQLPDGPGVDHPHGRPVRRPTRLPRTSEAGTAHVSPTELRNPPTYTYRPPTATPTTDFSPSSLHSYGLFIPPSDRTNLTTPAMLGSSDSSLALQRTHAVPDFSTIAPDAARMQDVSSQHQRRIIRDIRARRHELAPSTTASPDTDPFTPDVYDPNFLAAYRGSRSEDSASDSSDAALFLDRLRRRRNALGSESGGDNARLFGPPGSTEAQEAMVQRVRDRRQAGLTAAIDNLFTVEDDGIIAVDQGPRGLDRDDGRPEPKEDAEMMVNMECKICFSQLASVAVLPCGHCVMCKWCADQTIPSHKADRTRPAGVVNCPVCRKRVKQRADIYTG